MLRDWGQDRKYEHLVKGYNYRMDALQGAILSVKLRHLDAWTAARRKNAAHYHELLVESGAQIPREMSYARHVYHIYAIRTSQRQLLQQCLSADGIEAGIHYPVPVHLQRAHVDLGYRPGDFPRSEKVAAEILSLPMFAELTLQQQKAVTGAILRATADASSYERLGPGMNP
jgi:dTDP-4-amino-4,6-dideoxygalactose transaminase